MRFVTRTLRNLLLCSIVAVVVGTPACVAPTPVAGPRLPSGETSGPTIIDDNRDSVVADLIAAHNRVRAAHHRPPLTVNASLEAAAIEHADDMARHRWMSHRGSDFSSPFRRMAAQGYQYRRAGENVAAGYESVDSVMRGWMLSLGHRINILGTYTEIGAACATATNGTRFWCVTFGTPDSQ